MLLRKSQLIIYVANIIIRFLILGVRMVEKAQAEFIVIVGVIVLALVVIYYSTQSFMFGPSNVPSGVFEKQKAVQQSFLSMAGRGADNTLNIMEMHGGYPTEELLGSGNYTIPPYAVFMEEGVPYWARCQNNLTPSRQDVTRWFKLSLENYIETHIDEITASYKNATFDLSRLSVSVSILTDPRKIEITVNLPTKVDGYSMPSQLYPYKISLDSKLGEIYEFASDLSEAQSSKRFLEVFTEASILLSADAPDGYPKLPTGGFLTDCGETIYRTPDQVSLYLKEIAEYVLTQTLWWQKMSTDPSRPKVFAIDSEIMPVQYRDLEIGMYLPDGFKFTTRGGVVITNRERAYTSMFWTSSDCLGVYAFTYAASYPVIVSVKDPLSGHTFNFAFFVFVDNSGGKMHPGRCEDIREMKDVCSEGRCYARIKVTDDLGNPIQGAVATFGECGIGTSDKAGIIEGRINCGTYELNIYRNSSYDYYNQNVSSSAINGTYVLRPITNITAHFRRVTRTVQGPLTKCVIGKVTDYAFVDFLSGDIPYMITNINPDDVPENCTDQACLDRCQASMDINACMQCASGCMGSTLDSVSSEIIPSGSYTVNATMMSLTIMKETGGFLTPYTLKSSAKSIYIHLLESAPEYLIPESKKLTLAQELRQCQIEPISESPYPKVTYVTSCTCENLRLVWEDAKATCTNPNIGSMFCTCPSGSSYPSGCGQQCGDEYSPECVTCCNLDQVKQSIQSWVSNCDTRVICV
jgi:hypothetical protein